MTRAPTLCLDCGTPTTPGPRCPLHTRASTRARDSLRGTREQRGYDWTWRKIVKAAIEAHPYCSWCGTTRDLTGDHIIPISKGGRNVAENCEVLCRPCNSRKHNR